MTTLKQPTTSLYVGNLDPSVTEDILHEAFADFKTLTSVRLCKDSSGRSLGYGYANFLSREDANLAIIGKNNTLLEGKVMQVWPEASGVSNVK